MEFSLPLSIRRSVGTKSLHGLFCHMRKFCSSKTNEERGKLCSDETDCPLSFLAYVEKSQFFADYFAVGAWCEKIEANFVADTQCYFSHRICKFVPFDLIFTICEYANYDDEK